MTTRPAPTSLGVLKVYPEHVLAVRTYPNGNEHVVHVKQNGDLLVSLSNALLDESGARTAKEGLLLIVLGVDGGHDQVLVDCTGPDNPSMGELIGQAQHALELAAQAVRRVEESS